MKYVISDIHGNFNKFKQMLELINFNQNDVLYIDGDVIDRGNQSIEMLEYIMSQQNMKMLLGNHEDMLLGWFIDNDHHMLEMWLDNGGVQVHREMTDMPKEQFDRIIKFLNSRKLYEIIDNKYFLVHAGYHKEYKNELKSRDYMLWARQDFYALPRSTDGFTVIFGHTPTCYIINSKKNKMKIWHGQNKICIDCGTNSNIGQLSCLRLDDMKEFYV